MTKTETAATGFDWSRHVVDHVEVHASDYEESVRFYATVLDPLGIPHWPEDDENERVTCFTRVNVVDRRPPTTSLHLCFVAASRAPTGEVTGTSFTPLDELTGTITPADLHFERHHAGVPLLDPARHSLTVHGMVERPLVFTLEALRRFPQVTRVHFVECSGNGRSAWRDPKPELTAQRIAGMLSRWGTGEFLGDVAPSHAGDERMRTWMARLQRLAVDADALDRARRGALAAGDLRAFERRTGR